MEGFSVDVKINLWKKLTDILFSIAGMDKRKLQRTLRQIGPLMVPLVLLESGHIDAQFGLSEDNKTKLEESLEAMGGMLGPALMPFSELKNIVKPEDIPRENMVEEQACLVDAVEQFDDDVNVFFHLPNIAVEAKATVPGLGDLALQIMKRLK